jgi:hypothetical protein
MMIGRVFSDVTGQLRHLDFLHKVTLETSEQNLSLTRLQSINHRSNATMIVCVAEMNVLFVDEVCILD